MTTPRYSRLDDFGVCTSTNIKGLCKSLGDLFVKGYDLCGEARYTNGKWIAIVVRWEAS